MISKESIRQKVVELREITVKRNFIQTLELQLSLHRYDPKKKLLVLNHLVPYETKLHHKICIIGDLQHIEECIRLNIDHISVEELQDFKRDKKLIKKFISKYDIFLCSESILKQIPRLLGPSLHKAGKFPVRITHNDDLLQKYNELKRSLKWKFKDHYYHNPIGHESLTNDQLTENIYQTLLIIGNKNLLEKVFIKFTMGRSLEI